MRSTTNPLALLLAGALTLGLAGCGDDGGDGGGVSATLAYSFDSLPELGDGFVYEGWLIVDGEPFTTGRFSVDANGETTPATFDVDLAYVDGASAFVLTIEPEIGDDPAPADTHILAGNVTDDEIDLDVAHPAAIGTDFGDATGTFILATPTSESNDDETQGIWWLVPGDTPSAGLDLPTLPAGWTYEGWVASDDGPVSTGTFLAADGADATGPGAAAGPLDAPPFPGEDYVTEVRDLSAGYAAVISVEPLPDDSPAPFQIKPLAGPIGTEIRPATQTVPNDGGATNPSGAAIFTR